jgi:splicing factor 3B subunit 2
MIELRKKKIESDMEDNETPVLYKVLPEKPVNVGASMMGSSKVYDLSAAKKVAGESTDIDVALNPDELDLDSDTIQARYNQKLKEQHSAGGDKDDLSEMVSDHSVKQNKKRKKQQEQPSVKESEKDKATKKKEKEFKF